MARRKVQDKEAVEQAAVTAEGAGGEGGRAVSSGVEPSVEPSVERSVEQDVHPSPDATAGAVIAHLEAETSPPPPQGLKTEYATPRVIRLPNGITIYHH